ncbi:hypothetical protein L596_012760 [Steinernema carpocapsae]|uniref:Nucleoporin Nup54 alpha-helical domain-containing protein n=1 Tax=Steinernema carpocapsae TaxID=34508 RepID=A0A4U5NYD1_STECR|nr:hypothetical protein L596_012760 [Steinernema carpocapsae]
MSTPSKPGRNIDDARRRFAESRNRPMLQIPPTTSAMFGAPATTQAAPSGLFGAPASSTAAPTTGLFGSAPAAGGGLFGGSTTTQAPKPSTGLFGAPAASTAAPTTGLFGSAPVAGGGLFGGSTTTQAPASGLFGAAKPSGGLFGATTTAPTAPASGLFGAAQPQLAPAQQRGTIEDLIQNSSALVASVGDPQIYPDDRNQIVALLNQLQAVVGIGKGYYNSTSGPVEYTSNGPYFRLKGICYNRLSDHEDSMEWSA